MINFYNSNSEINTQIVPAGHKAVLFSKLSGVAPDAKNEGLNFKIPWLQVIIYFYFLRMICF